MTAMPNDPSAALHDCEATTCRHRDGIDDQRVQHYLSEYGLRQRHCKGNMLSHPVEVSARRLSRAFHPTEWPWVVVDAVSSAMHAAYHSVRATFALWLLAVTHFWRSILPRRWVAKRS